MALFTPAGLGWRPDPPDFRDFSPYAAPADTYLHALRAAGAQLAERAESVDLREYFLPVPGEQELNASCAYACAGLVEYFVRRASGRVVAPSPLFIYQNALKLAGETRDVGSDLRTTLKALVLCGAPPERLWSSETARFASIPEPFLYAFRAPYAAVHYVKLDRRSLPGAENLQVIKAFLAAGFPAAFGMQAPHSLDGDGSIPFRPTFDGAHGGAALIAVGYDDRWLHGSRGALLVRSSWGIGWGEQGYGWLPYAFVEAALAVDFWTMFHSDWIESEEFDLPDLPR